MERGTGPYCEFLIELLQEIYRPLRSYQIRGELEHQLRQAEQSTLEAQEEQARIRQVLGG